jgi:hypothetical protein
MMHGRQLEVNNVNQKNPKLNNSHRVFFSVPKRFWPGLVSVCLHVVLERKCSLFVDRSPNA